MRVCCSAMDALIYPYGDGELDADARAAVNAHVDSCAPCRDKLRWELGVLMHLRVRMTPPRAPAALRERIVQALAREDRQAGLARLFRH